MLLSHDRMKSLSLLEFAGALGIVSLSARLPAAVDRLDVLVRPTRCECLAGGYSCCKHYSVQRY